MLALGVQNATVTVWTRRGVLFPELPKVFAFGNPARSAESDLFAAILYAGPGAALCGLSAALWRGLVKWRTAEAIEVASPRRCRSLPAHHPANRLGRPIAVKAERKFRRWPYHGIPTVSPARIALDLAATGELQLVRFALANMDYMRILDEDEILAVCGRGRPGSALLLCALGNPQPRFAKSRSWFEIRFIVVCEETGIPLPETNEHIEGIEVDAVWWDEMVVVQCDGDRNHGTARQRLHDAADDLRLRDLGFLVIRYRYEQLDDPWSIHADITARLHERRGWATRRGYAA